MFPGRPISQERPWRHGMRRRLWHSQKGGQPCVMCSCVISAPAVMSLMKGRVGKQDTKPVSTGPERKREQNL